MTAIHLHLVGFECEICGNCILHTRGYVCYVRNR
ncbi:hypothetical protein EJ571_02715 [Mycobacteroides franklinii]|uniref:Methylene-tetrahydrofolate reductase C-terminal-like domain-containing protein n=1 Tax=Mycobacteroides franklinii TaxID=948102 RepID=A0A4R5PFD9_9MYCO|nr:hypothetical protein EJ571_02715 [Mycobacteroides franklinii]